MNACHACGQFVPYQETVWIDPVTGFPTLYGEPYHLGCAPPQNYDDADAARVEREVHRRLGATPAGLSEVALDRDARSMLVRGKASIPVEDIHPEHLAVVVEQLEDRLTDRELHHKIASVLHLWLDRNA